MQYEKFGNKIVVRIDRGEEIIDKIKEVATKENVRLAEITAIGAAREFTVGAFDFNEKKYASHSFSGCYEIVSLLGSVNTLGGEFYCHLHMCAAGADGVAVGGHLNRAIVGATCELFMTVTCGEVDRKFDETVGLNLFEFKNKPAPCGDLTFIEESNRVYAVNKSGETLAEITFPDSGSDKCEITRTYVADSLRGQGVAGKLMERAVKVIASRSRTPIPVCSYAVSWLEKHGK